MTDERRLYEEIKKELPPENSWFNESWERLAGESGRAYTAFCAYRDYGPERNIRRAVEAALTGKHGEAGADKVEKRYRMWRNWSTRFKWVKRAEDYDRYLDRLKQTEKRRTIEAQEAACRETAGKMLRVVNKKLDLMKPEELTQGNVSEWVETAVRTGREIAGITAAPRGERNSQNGKQLEIRFTPDFEGC
jgi:hypothetical protein